MTKVFNFKKDGLLAFIVGLVGANFNIALKHENCLGNEWEE